VHAPLLQANIIKTMKGQVMTNIDPINNLEENDGTKAEKVAEAKAYLLDIIKVKVNRVIKYKTDPFSYNLETETSSVHLGSIKHLIEQKYLRRKIADATGVLIPKIDKNDWPEVAQALLDLCELELVGKDATNKRRVRHR